MIIDRKFWIDALKAICIICVYVYHTGFYYGIDYNFVFVIKPFYVNGFFFISGYLFFRSYMKKDRYLKKDYIVSIKNVLFRLVIPTILFSIILYLPKHYASANGVNFIIYTFGGTAFWFTSALSVAQITFSTMFLSNIKNVWTYTFLSTILLVLLNMYGDIRSKEANEYFPWFWQTGLMYMFIMSLGGLYYKYESITFKIINKPYVISTLLITYACILLGSLYTPIYFWGLSGKNNFLGIVGTIIAILLLIYATNKIKKNKIIEFIGKNSIIFYFLSGISPIVVSTITCYLTEKKTYAIYVLVTIISLLVSSFVSYIISRYLPFIIDLRNLINVSKKNHK